MLLLQKALQNLLQDTSFSNRCVRTSNFDLKRTRHMFATSTLCYHNMWVLELEIIWILGTSAWMWCAILSWRAILLFGVPVRTLV